jgi:tetratricopeptide (TPR) repeat protein
VKAFDFLLGEGELDGATKRLQETFITGEYMPSVRLILREKKRRCLDYAQKTFQLISAVNVRDYTRAETLVTDMKKAAKDFDDTLPRQAITVAREKQRGLLVLARQAALNGDQAKTATLMEQAAAEWPDSKQFREASEKLYTQGDVVQRTLLEFDQLLSQKNYRQIWDDQARFIAAASVDAERGKTLTNVLLNMRKIEATLLRAEEMGRQGVYAGAWETLERSWAEFPDDPKLNQLRADMTTRASDFVRVIRDAESLEKKEQYGSSLSHYLKARKLYPASDFARDGVNRLVKQVLPGT